MLSNRGNANAFSSRSAGTSALGERRLSSRLDERERKGEEARGRMDGTLQLNIMFLPPPLYNYEYLTQIRRITYFTFPFESFAIIRSQFIIEKCRRTVQARSKYGMLAERNGKNIRDTHDGRVESPNRHLNRANFIL